jgi:malate dehydrogenase
MAQRKKISVIGAGNIGGELAMLIARRELGDCVLLDIPEKADFARGKALDIMQTGALDGFDCNVHGTSDYKDIAGSDVVIVTAGVPRKPGMSRDDLLSINLKIIRAVAAGIKENAPKAFVVVISNPLDAMVYEMKKVTGFDPKMVVGMAGVLDSARMQCFLAMACKCSTKDVRALVLGGHGDTMVPALGYCTINGIPVKQLLPADVIDGIVKRTAGGGGEIVKLMGTSAYYAPAAGAVEMAEAYLRDEKRILACAAYLNGEYGYKDMYIGVPVVIGGGGAERVVQIDLSADEKAMLDKSAEAVRGLITDSAKL